MDLQLFVPSGGFDVLPRVLQVELSLVVPELVVVDSIQMGVTQFSEDLPGVVPCGKEIGVSGTSLLGGIVAPLDYLRPETSDAVRSGRADYYNLE